MPKSKEQKRLEAQQRQLKSAMGPLMANALQWLPGGGLCQGYLGRISSYDIRETVTAFGKMRDAFNLHGIKLPMHADDRSLSNIDFLLKCLSPIWMSSLFTMYEQELQKYHEDRSVVSSKMCQIFNAAGAANENGESKLITHEVKNMKEALRKLRIDQ